MRNGWLGLALCVLVFLGASGHAQTIEFLPEINTSVQANQNVRFVFQAKQTREGGEPTQAEIGPSIDFYWRPLQKLIRHDADDAKTRLILLSFGYRYLPSPDAPTTNRILMVATPRFPLKSKIIVSDRNRGELNFSNGDLTWRYRNRLQLEREISIRSYHPSPYANVEVYYDSKYQKWSSTAIEVGCQFPIRKNTQIDFYYEHENNTGKAPNQQVNSIGLALNLFFRP
jgi:hypothetical protein